MKYTKISFKNKILRMIWSVVWLFLYRTSPIPCHAWRRFLLRLFGAKIGKFTHPYPSSKIWAPWNLTMNDHSCLSHHVDCYCVDKVTLGTNVTVSQYSFLCTASHDYTQQEMPLVTAPITIQDNAWITADVFIALGVTIGEGSVVGARSVVTKDVAPWTVVAGHPAKFIKVRHIQEAHSKSR
jgi:putative colanic acid biosynthesis acetyltransferase WcaF